MQNHVSIFNFENQSVRTATNPQGEVYFCLRDVVSILSIKNSRDVVAKQLDKKGVEKIYTLTDGGNQEVTFINEPNLYRVIFRSNKAEAVKFQNWVFDEVLPSIRKTGSYSAKITDSQAYQIQKAIKQKCLNNKVHYQTIYHALYDEFGVKSYKDILAGEFERALAFIESFVFTPNLALVHNILADQAHQNKKAKGELNEIIDVVRHLLDHIGELQHRLDVGERNIKALQTRFII